MTITPFKYIIQPVAIEKDENGQIIREIPAEPGNAYNLDQAVELIRKFEEGLKASQNGSAPAEPLPQ